MKRCLILGGDGFLGSHLADDLLQRGYSIRVFGRFKKNIVKNINHIRGRIELFSGDFLNTSDLEKALEGANYVFHFISSSNPATTIHKPGEEAELNILPTIKLLNLCTKKGIKKIIFPSSGGSIYGNCPRNRASEEDSLNPISPHALSKLYIEKLLYCHFRQSKLDYVIYRISNVYGERQRAKNQGIISTIMHKALRGEKIEIYGNTIRDYIYVKDVTSFIAENFDKKHSYRVYNIGSGKGITLHNLLNTLKEQTGLPLYIKKLNRRSCDVEKIVLNTQRVKKEFHFLPKTTIEKGIKKTYNDICLNLKI